VGHATSQPANCVHSLCLLKLRFQAMSIGDVAIG
jgi:hypothetical protein